MNGTSTERKPDTQSDTLVKAMEANALKRLEASAGIEPAYTDLQSVRYANQNKGLGQNKYQDIARTPREPDTSAFSTSPTKNPGAAATATGAKDVVEGVSFAGEYSAFFPILAMHWGALI